MWVERNLQASLAVEIEDKNVNGEAFMHHSQKLMIKVDRWVEKGQMKNDVQETLTLIWKEKKIEVNSGTHNFHKHVISYLFYFKVARHSIIVSNVW